MIKVVYYYYYLFYRVVLKDDTPQLLAVLALAASLGFLVGGSIDIILIRLFCLNISKWWLIAFHVGILTWVYSSFYAKGRGERIIMSKPLIAQSHWISLVTSLTFFLLSLSMLFWEPILAKELLRNCN